MKLNVNDSYERDEKVTTTFEPSKNEDVLNKGYIDTKFTEIKGNLLFIEKVFKEIELYTNKQSVEEILIEGAVKTTIQIFYNGGLNNFSDNLDQVIKDYFSTEKRRDPYSNS